MQVSTYGNATQSLLKPASVASYDDYIGTLPTEESSNSLAHALGSSSDQNCLRKRSEEVSGSEGDRSTFPSTGNLLPEDTSEPMTNRKTEALIRPSKVLLSKDLS